ncbi:MAG: uracil-DNA glycosylase [Acidobacteriota bacterium]
MSRDDLLRYARDLGWRDVDLAGRVTPEVALPDAARGRDAALSAPDLASMSAALADCRLCRLSQGRTQVVFGAGSSSARVMFVGEAPGADEDRLGQPFVGRAGQLLNAMLRAIDLRREDVYIANVIKCRPPGNRDPQDDEVAACLPFLLAQVERIDPPVIVTLGRVSYRHLTGSTAPISSYRGRWTTWRGRDLLPTFHPAYLLRNPAAKAQAWIDLKALRRRLSA